MKYVLLTTGLVALLAVAAIAVFSARKTTEEKPAPPNFYYFPKANIYLNTTDSSYTFWDSNDETWRATKNLPDSLNVLLDKKIFLDHPLDPVWKNNEEHRMLSAVTLYASPADFKEKPVVKKENKTVKQDTADAEEQHESGIKKLLKKIFKGKKD